jgi:hypothetical protein
MPDDPESFAEAQGVVLGRLQARLPDRIIVGDLALFLPRDTKAITPRDTKAITPSARRYW